MQFPIKFSMACEAILNGYANAAQWQDPQATSYVALSLAACATTPPPPPEMAPPAKKKLDAKTQLETGHTY